jgi:hypothetical protein
MVYRRSSGSAIAEGQSSMVCYILSKAFFEYQIPTLKQSHGRV